jgi:hypothetical protein
MSSYSRTAAYDMKSLIERLRRSEQDFTKKLAYRRAALDAAGHWHWNDPLHQRLSSGLRRVRQELADAEAELRRRSRAAVETQ